MSIIIALAVLGDLMFGEPSNRFHPVVWMGTFITWARKWHRPPACDSQPASWKPMLSRLGSFAMGATIVVVGSLVVGGLGFLIEKLFSESDSPGYLLGIAAHALILKCCFGIRSLHHAASEVASELDRGNLTDARRKLAYHLVSRDVSRLSESEVAAATIESVAENTSDSVVAPLFFYLVAGLPGALVYRFANTCDAMLGYRTEELEWLGKFAARFDDLLNLIPARFTAWLMIFASGPKLANSWKTYIRDRYRTASPNAGQPMSVAAGALSVCLTKPNHYRLGEGFRDPIASDVPRMLMLYQRTVCLAVVIVVAAPMLFPWWSAIR